jgi:hypothetical protein
VTWLAEHLKLPMPPSVDSHLVGAGQVIRGRRLNNGRLKRELKLSLSYPSYREGEAQIDACESSGALPVLRMQGADAGSPSQTGSDAAAPPALPPLTAAQSGTDLGETLGGAPLGATFVRLSTGERRELGGPCLILSGYLSVSRRGQAEGAGPRTLVPTGASLYNLGPEPAEILVFAPRS